MRTPYRHEALFFASQQALLAASVQWLRAGLDAGEVIALACDAENNAALAAAVGRHPAVRMLPQERIYHKAVDAVAFYHDLITTNVAAGHARVRVLGEVGSGTSARGRDEWLRFEAVCNHARARPATVQRVRLPHPGSATAADRHRPGQPPLGAHGRRHRTEPRLSPTRPPAQRHRSEPAYAER